MSSSPVQNEKSYEVDERVTSSSPSSSDNQERHADTDSTASGEVDAAWAFLQEHRNVEGVDQVDLKALRTRIDWRIVPLMFCCYTMQFLDKVIYNVSVFVKSPPQN